jgi:hypothetical protein
MQVLDALDAARTGAHVGPHRVYPPQVAANVAVSSSGHTDKEVRPINARSGRVLSFHGRAVHPA